MKERRKGELKRNGNGSEREMERGRERIGEGKRRNG
jgi:hypothetical protein